MGSNPVAPAKPFCFILRGDIIKFTHLDWFRFHGKQYVTKLLENEGFYNITIRRKMSLEESKSFIVITGNCLSPEEGAVYGKAQIFQDGIISDESFAGYKILEIMQTYCNDNSLWGEAVKKEKPKYFNYKISK